MKPLSGNVPSFFLKLYHRTTAGNTKSAYSAGTMIRGFTKYKIVETHIIIAGKMAMIQRLKQKVTKENLN